MYMKKFVRDLRVADFLWVFKFPLPITLTEKIPVQLNYCWKWHYWTITISFVCLDVTMFNINFIPTGICHVWSAISLIGFMISLVWYWLDSAYLHSWAPYSDRHRLVKYGYPGCIISFVCLDVPMCVHIAVFCFQTGTHHDILSTMSMVGCILSIVCLVLTLLIYTIEWR